MQPTIGITTFTSVHRNFEHPPGWEVGQPYVRAVVSAGGIPWIVPLLGDDEPVLREIYDRLDALLLPGGSDVEPSCYGAERDPLTGRSDPPRDLTEMTLARWALEDGKPLLAICRGAQVLNAAAGGTLIQDIANDCTGALAHDQFEDATHPRDLIVHEVRIDPDSRLYELLHGAEVVRVNSMHHQAIDRVGAGLRVTARADDRIIEGIEGTGTVFTVGVQWHPEDMLAVAPAMHSIFSAFISAADAYRHSRRSAISQT